MDGQSITYDAIGNPTSYYNGTQWVFTWARGRQLATASNGTDTISYTYDADGLRTSKTVNGTVHTYYYAGSKLLREIYGSNTLDFFYDASGYPFAFKYSGTLYYYITNLQGDVMSIVDAQGEVVASYSYDTYGNILTATGPLADVNPLRYRGYVYDTETQFYYLQSRYYDPEIGRFINADAYASTGQGILGNNMFAYCNNAPVNKKDPLGTAASQPLLGDSHIFPENMLMGGGSGSGSQYNPLPANQLEDSKVPTALKGIYAVGKMGKALHDIFTGFGYLAIPWPGLLDELNGIKCIMLGYHNVVKSIDLIWDLIGGNND